MSTRLGSLPVTTTPDTSVPPPAPNLPHEPRRRFAAILGFALLSCIALLSAEYASARTLAPLLVGRTLLTYLPYYVLLVALIARYGPLSVRSLYLFGAVLGLASESFVTKAAWAHPTSGQPLSRAVAGFDLGDLLTVVFTCYPVLSVVLPTLLCAAVFGTPYHRPLARWQRYGALLLLPVLTGLLAGFGHQPPALFAAALIVNAVTLTALVAAYRRWGGPVSRVPRVAVVTATLLIVGWSAVAFRMHYVPAPGTVAVTVPALLVLVCALGRSVRRDRRAGATVQPAARPPDLRWRGYLAYLVGYAAVATAGYALLSLTGGVGATLVALLALVAGAAGTGYLLFSVIQVLSPVRR